jgi:hypothetical protein
MKTISRKQFLGALGSGTMLLWLQACGGGGDDDGGDDGLSCGASAITSNHGHTLTIDEADLDSSTDKTYSIMGTASHDHSVTFTVAQLGMLKNGQSVTVTSSTGSGHTHDVTVSCM